jgi:lysozyme family protein
MNFDQAFERLIGHEGAYANDPRDPGGETMYGVTKRVAVANGYTGPMRDLTLAQAKAIYKASYWDSVKADQLPEDVRFDVFDAAANSGVAQASKWLQRAVGVPDDGAIGPKTIAAALMAGPKLAARYNGTRLQFMSDLAAWPAFGRGWAKRIASNLIGA